MTMVSEYGKMTAGTTNFELEDVSKISSASYSIPYQAVSCAQDTISNFQVPTINVIPDVDDGVSPMECLIKWVTPPTSHLFLQHSFQRSSISSVTSDAYESSCPPCIERHQTVMATWRPQPAIRRVSFLEVNGCCLPPKPPLVQRNNTLRAANSSTEEKKQVIGGKRDLYIMSAVRRFEAMRLRERLAQVTGAPTRRLVQSLQWAESHSSH